MKSVMPLYFLAHGSPMLALEHSPQAEFLQKLGKEIPRPKAILIFSAHWETEATKILNVSHPEMIYDFRGFPKELSRLKYPALGDAQLAKEILQKIPQAQLSKDWGFDHGVWTVLMHMFPAANVPVVPMSLNRNLSPLEYFEIGRQLADLRQEGILILGSGNIVHNLRAMDHSDEIYDWAKSFDEFVGNAIQDRDFERLFRYEEKGCMAELSVPTAEHLNPLFPILGASLPSDKITFPFLGFQFGSISLRSVQFQQQ